MHTKTRLVGAKEKCHIDEQVFKLSEAEKCKKFNEQVLEKKHSNINKSKTFF